MEGLPWPTITAASGGWLLTGAFVIALIRGRLVPRSTLEDASHDRDEWRAESRIKDAQLSEKDSQLQHLAEVGRSVDSLVQSLRTAASRSTS